MLDSKKLSNESLKSAPQNRIVVFEEKFKQMSGGSPDKKIRCAITIAYEFGKNNPWAFSIENTECGTKNGKIDTSNIIRTHNSTMYLNDKEMSTFIWTIQSLQLIFENHAFNKAAKFIEDNKWKPNT